MTIRVLAATAAAFAVAAGAAGVAEGTQLMLKKCGTVTAAGWTFDVEVARLNCAAARATTKKLAGMGLPSKPTPYPGTYLKLHCFGSSGTAEGRKVAIIQCTSSDGRSALYAGAKR